MLHRILVALALLILSTATVTAFDSFEIRARTDLPTEADREGWSLWLVELSDGDEMIAGSAVVPESFGKVETPLLTIKDGGGQRLAELTLGEGLRIKGRANIDFKLRRDLLTNSVLSVGRLSEEDGLHIAHFILGSFRVRTRSEFTDKPVPAYEFQKNRLALAEFGRFGFMGQEEFSVTDKISTEKGEQYGLRLYLRGDGRSLPVRIESGTPDDRKTRFTGMIATEKLVDYHLWESSPEDPPGEHEVRVYVQNRLIKTLKFTVPVPPPAEGSEP